MWKNKEKKEIKYNLHHICPSSRWGTWSDVNCEMIRVTTHTAIHTLFWNDIFPEQLIKLTHINAKALKPEIAAQLIEILNQRNIHNPDDRYKDECLRLPKQKFYK